MKNHWHKYKLNDVIELIGGGTPKTSIKEYWDGDIPWLSVVDFNNGQKRVYNTEKKITELGLKNSSAKILKKGQLIISARGTVGVLSELGRDMSFNQSCYGINAKPELTTNRFLYYLINYNINQVRSNAYGSVFDSITTSTFENIDINLPPLSEQESIAEILSILDDKIELNLQMNKTLEEMAMALYKHWLVDFGPFKNGRFVESEMGMIPEGWKMIELKEIASINTESSKPFNNPNNLYYHYSLPSFDDSNVAKLELGSSIASNKTKITTETILVSKLNPKIRRVWTVFPSTDYECISSTEFMNYIPLDEVYFGYLNCFLRANEFFDSLLSQATGTSNSHQRAQPKETLLLKVAKPNINVIRDFNDKIMSYFMAIHENTQESILLKQTRDYLLPKLISGEIRVKDAEKMVK
ncbi:MAG TPA: restriction endonuclease subunit S [Bacteroidia bacterium]|nr:restriction endonuclease subunit S [Bacteroidia bacterium]